MPNPKYSTAQINFIPCNDHKEKLEEYCSMLSNKNTKEVMHIHHNLLMKCELCRNNTYIAIMSIINNICNKKYNIRYETIWWYNSKRSKYYLCDSPIHNSILKNRLGECCWKKKLERWIKDMVHTVS